MAKKNDNPQQQPVQTETAAVRTAPPPAAALPSGDRTVTKGQLITFWSAVALTAAAAWILALALPGTSESVIERWLMLPFGLFLVLFLARLNK